MNWFDSAKEILAKWKAQEKAWSLFRDKFTPRARQVLAIAGKEAQRLGHNYLGTEHLLLGIIKLGQGVAVNVFGKMGLELDAIRNEIKRHIKPVSDQKMIGTPFTPRVKRVLELAQMEADALKNTYVGTEHILLGLLREGGGVAGQVFKNLNVDIEQTRKEILKELDPNFLPGEDGQDKQG
jgi:ATP-dependent Clp protease ATP-binding subunit ClpC